MQGLVANYGRLAIGTLLFGTLTFLEKLFTGPIAFVTGMSDIELRQWVTAAFAFTLTLLVVRITKREFIHGWLESRTGKKVPPLIGDMIGWLVLFTGVCLILSVVFKRDITALVAAGGVSMMVVGLAVRDIILALFTGIVLNVEKPFEVGDKVLISGRLGGKDIVGHVRNVTWRTTVLETTNNEIVFIPNITLSNAIIVNMALPGTHQRRAIEVVIDYDTSVESAERILYAAVLGAAGVRHYCEPTVFARRMERDGVVYEVAFTITHYADAIKAEHAVIKSILQCMRDAEITVSFPKTEVIQSPQRVSIANRSLDVFRLVQQCRLFRGLPDAVGHRISKALIERHYAPGAIIVEAGERHYSAFIIGEGMAKRTLTDRDGSQLIQERFIATEFFGRRSLFAGQPQVATVLAETAVLAYELDRRALGRLLEETPDLLETLSQTLSHLHWRETNADTPGCEPSPEVIARMLNVYRGQLASCFGAAIRTSQKNH